jgi:tetratricopeptide (TPR) repeat protein
LVFGFVALMASAAMALPVLGADGDKIAAKAHFEAATRLYDIHEYAKALEEYKAAYLAKPDPAFLFNVGQCYRRLGKFDQALEFYREYLKKAPPDDPNRPNVEARIRNTDNSDVFESDAPPKPAPSPTQPLPHPAELPPVHQPPIPLVFPPVVEPGPEEAVEKPASEAASPVSFDQSSQAPTLPPAAGSVAAKPAGLDLTVAEPAGQVSSGTPFYSTWWFWTGVGAAVVAGTVAAILLSKSGSDGNSPQTALGTQPVFQ